MDNDKVVVEGGIHMGFHDVVMDSRSHHEADTEAEVGMVDDLSPMHRLQKGILYTFEITVHNAQFNKIMK